MAKIYNHCMRRVNWTVTEAQHRALKQLSQNTGLSISELVRRALDTYIHALNQDQAAGAAGPLTPTEKVEHEEPKN